MIPSIVNQIVGRVYVGKSDSQAIRYFVSRLKKGAWKKRSRAERKQWMRWVIAAHRENQRFYDYVMGRPTSRDVSPDVSW